MSAIVFVVFLLLGVAPVAADGPENPTLLAADGISPVVTADGTAVVYLAPYGPGWELGLYAVAPTGGPTANLSPGLNNGQYIDQFWVSPDSEHAVFKVEDPIRGTTNLYSVPIGAGTPTKLNRALSDGDHVASVAISPDSAYVVFETMIRPAWRHEVFSIPIGGGTPVRLSPPLDASNSGGGYDAAITPDSSQVVFVSREPATFSATLLVTPITHRDLAKLDEDPTGLGDHQVTPDSRRVVYMAGEGSLDMFSAVMSGTVPPVKLAENLNHDEGSSTSFAISPDSKWVVIQRADRQDPPLLSSVPIDGGAEIPIGVFPPGRISGERAQITSDSQHILYVGQVLGEGTAELFREPIGGGNHVMLTAAADAGDEVSPFFTMAEGEKFVAYTARAGLAEEWDVFTIPAAGGTARQLTQGFDGGYGGDGAPLITANGSRIVFTARAGPTNTLELYSVPTVGGTTSKLNGVKTVLLISGEPSVAITPDSTRVVYGADPQGVYSVPIGFVCAGHFATIVGTSGDDILLGTPLPDIIHARAGDDLIRGMGGADVICAGRGDDAVYGGRGGDTVLGGPGADSLWGHRGWDKLRGGAGPDILDGGPGHDTCFGGPGHDTLTRCE